MTKHNLTFYAIILNLLIIPLFPWKTYIGPIPLAAEIVLIPLLVLAFLWDLKNKRIEFNNFPVKRFITLFSLFLVVQIISLIEAYMIIPGLMEIARYLSYVFLFLIAATVKFDKHEYKLFGISLLIAFAVSTLYGILQFAFDFNLNKAGLYALEEAHGRVQALTMNPNYWAGLLNFVLPLALLLAVVWAKNWKLQLILISVFGFIVINQIFTYTRSAWVIMFLAIILSIALTPKTFLKKVIKPQLIIPIVLLIVVVYNLPDVQQRAKSAMFVIDSFIPGITLMDTGETTEQPEGGGVLTDEEKNKSFTNHAVVSRTTLWKTGYYMFKENPILGVGIGNYLNRYEEYVTKYPELYIGHEEYSVHNSFLKVAAETGFIGLLTFMAIYAFYYIYIIKLYLETKKDALSQVLLIGLFVGSGTFMGQNLSNNLIFIPQINVMFWIISGLILAFVELRKGKIQQETAKNV